MSNQMNEYPKWVVDAGGEQIRDGGAWEYEFASKTGIEVCLMRSSGFSNDRELFDLNVARYFDGTAVDCELLGLNRSQVASLLLILEVITSDVYFKAAHCDE